MSEGVLSALYLVGAFGLPALIYVANRKTRRLKFRFLGPLAVAVTGVVLAIYSVQVILPAMIQAVQEQGKEVDTEGYLLGGVISGLFWAVIGVAPLALYHSLQKRKARNSGAAAGAKR